MKRALSLFLALSVILSMVHFSAFANDDPDAPIQEELFSGINITKTVDRTAVKVGETVTYTLVLMNTGDTKLTDITVTDDFSGNIDAIEIGYLEDGVTYLGNGVFEIDAIAVRDVVMIPYEYTTVEGDIGVLTNTVTIECIPEGGTEDDIIDDDDSCDPVTVEAAAPPDIPAEPFLTVEKVLTSIGEDASAVWSNTPTRNVLHGETIHWTITVTNEGAAPGTFILKEMLNEDKEVQILDASNTSIPNGSSITIPADSTMTFEVFYEVSAEDAGTTLKNIVILADDDNDPTNDPRAESAEIYVDNPKVSGIDLAKTVDRPSAKVGETVTYTLVLTNTGDTVLTDLKVADTFSGNIETIKVNQLPAGATYTGNGVFELDNLDLHGVLTIVYEYTTSDRDVGVLTNTATVECIPEGGNEDDKITEEDTCSPVTIEEKDIVIEEEPKEEAPEEEPIRPVKPRPQLNQTGEHFSYIIGYPDGKVYPLGSITRAEVATIFFRLLTDESRDYYWSQENLFSDVNDGDWYNNAVSTMAAAGILNGYPDGTFRPNAPVSRAEFAAIASRFTEEGRDGVSQSHFKKYFQDVDQSDWYAAAVELAYELGWAQGYDGHYRPEALMTRAEVMTMVNRIMKRDVERHHMLEDMLTWSDNDPNAWYYEAVQEATNSHTYQRTKQQVPYLNFYYEKWETLMDNPDWAVLEQSWSHANS